ncbi:unnamed protein product [Calypogeia fissa]
MKMHDLSALGLGLIIVCLHFSTVMPHKVKTTTTPTELNGSNFTYPWPVLLYKFNSQNQRLEMAYMDVCPTTPNGHTIVLLHGKNFCGATWNQTAIVLLEAGYRVVIPDQIGFCKSSKPERSFHIGTSSQEESTPPQICCKFQGAFFRLDAKTGKTVCRTPMLPYNNNQTGLYAGAGIWGSSPAIDIFRRSVYIGTGNTYSVPPPGPPPVQDCKNARQNETNATVPDSCINPDDHSESIVAIDIDSHWQDLLGHPSGRI